MLEVEGEATPNHRDDAPAKCDRATEHVVTGVAVDELDADEGEEPAAEHDQADVHAEGVMVPSEDERSKDCPLGPECFGNNPRPAVRTVLEDPAREVVLVERSLAECSDHAEVVNISFRVDRGVELSVVDLMGFAKCVSAFEGERSNDGEQDAVQPVWYPE